MNKTRLISIVLPAIIVAGSVCLWLLNRQPADERRSQRELARFVSEGSRGKPPSPRLPPKEDRPSTAGGLHGMGAGAKGATPQLSGAKNPLVQSICGPSSYQSLRELAARGPLSRSDCEALSDFLKEKTDDEGIERIASIKNSVMNLLARQPNLPSPWSDLLRRVLLDETQHPVIRDYALQHAFSLYEEAIQGTALQTLDSTGRGRLLELFWAALERKQESLAGTALVGLFHLSEFDASVDRGRLGRQSLAVLEAAETGELARISGFQVCRLLGEQGALQPSVAHAEKRESIPLRVSAIAAVGALGGDTELPLLRRLLAEANPSVRVAAKAAVQRIQFKTNR